MISIISIIEVYSTKSPQPPKPFWWVTASTFNCGVYKNPLPYSILIHTDLTGRLLRSYKYKLEKDLTDKLEALNIDSGCATLTDKSPQIGYGQGAVKIQTK